MLHINVLLVLREDLEELGEILRIIPLPTTPHLIILLWLVSALVIGIHVVNVIIVHFYTSNMNF